MVPLILMLLGCNPAGSAFKEAEGLAAEGKFDDAIVKYEQVAQGWPDSPEAKMVPDAVFRVLSDKSVALYDKADWAGVVAVQAEIHKRKPQATSPAMDEVVRWMALTDHPEDPAFLDVVVSNAGRSDAFGGAVRKDACDKRARTAAWKACDALPKPDLGPNVRVPPDVASITDIPALSGAIEACPKVMPLKDMCPDAAEAFTMLPDVEAMKRRFQDLSSVEAAALTKQITSAGEAWCAADAAWNRLTERQALLVLDNRLGAALAMERESTAASKKAGEKREVFEGLEKVLKAAPWPADVKKPVQAEYDAWEKKCD